MKIDVKQEFDTTADGLVLGMYADEKLDEKNPVLAEELNAAIAKKTFEHEFGRVFQTKITNAIYKRILVVSLGKKEEMTIDRVRRAIAKGVAFSKEHKFSSLTSNMLDKAFESKTLDNNHAARAVAEGIVLSSYAFKKYVTDEKKKNNTLQKITLKIPNAGNKDILIALREGEIIAEATNDVKDLVNEPANVVNPDYLEKEAQDLARKDKNIKLTILRRKELAKAGLGALLGVSTGSDSEPRLIILQYNNNPKEKPTAIVGKGITFDSGGYDIKPSGQFTDMKCDMSGAGAVLGTIKIASLLGLKRNIIGIIPTTENLISSAAQKPGDIVRAYNGKTIEIMNTDAEGRLILADAIAYAEKNYAPEIIIDLATLTGACVVALGYYASGIISNDEQLSQKLMTAGVASYDRVWPLPFYEEYQDNMDGDISDLKNMSVKGKGREAGAITAAVFLSKFVEKAKWAHIDIAGPAFLAESKDYNQKYATGAGVRLLSYYFMG